MGAAQVKDEAAPRFSAAIADLAVGGEEATLLVLTEANGDKSFAYSGLLSYLGSHFRFSSSQENARAEFRWSLEDQERGWWARCEYDYNVEISTNFGSLKRAVAERKPVQELSFLTSDGFSFVDQGRFDRPYVLEEHLYDALEEADYSQDLPATTLRAVSVLSAMPILVEAGVSFGGVSILCDPDCEPLRVTLKGERAVDSREALEEFKDLAEEFSLVLDQSSYSKLVSSLRRSIANE